MNPLRLHPASPNIICLGLGRTGTTSLRVALKCLGFGPCYCMSVILRTEGRDLATWKHIDDGGYIPGTFDELFRDYSVIMDYPAAMYPQELYSAYPNAKFILTIRDPVTWEKSMRVTILRVAEVLRQKKTKTGFEGPLSEWLETKKYHRGRLFTHTQEEILEHNERIMKIIPPEKLLIFDVRDGWDKLVGFLDVPKPAEPFPHVNNTAAFEESLLRKLET